MILLFYILKIMSYRKKLQFLKHLIRVLLYAFGHTRLLKRGFAYGKTRNFTHVRHVLRKGPDDFHHPLNA